MLKVTAAQPAFSTSLPRQRVLDQCGLQDVTLVGFSMGGGEVARFVSRCGESRLRSVVFAAAVPPCLLKSADNPEGPLLPAKAQELKAALEDDRDGFFDQFTRDFFSVGGALKVNEALLSFLRTNEGAGAPARTGPSTGSTTGQRMMS